MVWKLELEFLFTRNLLVSNFIFNKWKSKEIFISYLSFKQSLIQRLKTKFKPCLCLNYSFFLSDFINSMISS